MKVWVPIDLPEGCRVGMVSAIFDDTSKGHVWLDPLGPVRPFDEEPAKPIGSAIRGGPYSPEAQRERSEPQRERWEYMSLDKGAYLYPLPNAVGKDGWEMFWLADDRTWFKRRMIP